MRMLWFASAPLRFLLCSSFDLRRIIPPVHRPPFFATPRIFSFLFLAPSPSYVLAFRLEWRASESANAELSVRSFGLVRRDSA